VSNKFERTWKIAVMVWFEVLSLILLEDMMKTSLDIQCITLLQMTIDNLNLCGKRALSHVLISFVGICHFFIHSCFSSINVGLAILDCSVL
jgi:hypothetical protein